MFNFASIASALTNYDIIKYLLKAIWQVYVNMYFGVYIYSVSLSV